jgi:ATP-dependent DNA helicase RecG
MPSFQQLGLDFEGSHITVLTIDEIYQQLDSLLIDALFEDRRIEYKSGRIDPPALADVICMWANTADGGIIVVGVEKDKSISGCSSLTPDQVNGLDCAGMDFCPDARFESKRLQVENSRGEKDWVLVFRVRHRHDKVVMTSSKHAFRRVGDSKRKLTMEEIQELRIERKEIDFELEPCDLSYPADFNAESIRAFVQAYCQRGNLTDHAADDVLELAHLGRRTDNGFVPNNACALLFAKDPQLKFRGAFIRFFRFDGESERTGEKFNAVKDMTIEGSIPEQIIAMESVLDGQLRTFSRLGKDGKFFTAPEYPKAAWYEAIVNACVHRSYSLRTMNIFVKMFDDRLLVESPGGFPFTVTPETIYENHVPRNPHLMNALRYFDFVLCAHEGTRRMRDTMSEMELPPPDFKQVGSGVVAPLVHVVLKNNVRQRRVWVDSDVSQILGEAVAKGLNDNEKRAVNFVAEYAQISVSDVQRLTQKSWPASKRILVGLVKKGILRHKIRESLDRDPQARFVLAWSGDGK